MQQPQDRNAPNESPSPAPSGDQIVNYRSDSIVRAVETIFGLIQDADHSEIMFWRAILDRMESFLSDVTPAVHQLDPVMIDEAISYLVSEQNSHPVFDQDRQISDSMRGLLGLPPLPTNPMSESKHREHRKRFAEDVFSPMEYRFRQNGMYGRIAKKHAFGTFDSKGLWLTDNERERCAALTRGN